MMCIYSHMKNEQIEQMNMLKVQWHRKVLSDLMNMEIIVRLIKVKEICNTCAHEMKSRNGRDIYVTHHFPKATWPSPIGYGTTPISGVQVLGQYPYFPGLYVPSPLTSTAHQGFL